MSAPVDSSLRELLSDVLGLDEDALGDEPSMDSLEAWDSLRHLDVVLALEQRTGATFSPDEIAAMRSLRAIADVLAARKLSA